MAKTTERLRDRCRMMPEIVDHGNAAHFAAHFLALWNSAAAAGDAYPRSLFADEAGRRAFAGVQQTYMRHLFADTLGFAAAKMIRRILGLAHVLDLESIKDPDRRAQCERRALRLATDVAKLGAGAAAYALTRRTSAATYDAMVSLHCATQGRSTDVVQKLVELRHPAAAAASAPVPPPPSRRTSESTTSGAHAAAWT